MKNLDLDWPTIDGCLKKIPGFNPKAVETYFQEGQVKKGIHFFLIEYEPGEIVMAKGTTSDFAALHLDGVVRVIDAAPKPDKTKKGCWTSPMLRRLENIVLNPTRGSSNASAETKPTTSPFAFLRPLYRRVPVVPLGLISFSEFWFSSAAGERMRRHVSNVFGGLPLNAPRPEREVSRPTQAARIEAEAKGVALTIRDKAGVELPIEDRFLGITGTLWNQPRSVTLVAENDGDKKCRMLLIKRKAFQEIIKKCPAFYDRKMTEFINSTLPSILAKNRLFRERFFVTEVNNWGRLLEAFQGKGAESPLPQVIRNMTRRLSGTMRGWIMKTTEALLLPEEKIALVRQLNILLGDRELVPANLIEKIPTATGAGDKALLSRSAEGLAGLNGVELSRLNRMAVEAALPGVFASCKSPCPMTRAEFQAFTRALARKHEQKFGKALQPERIDKKGEAVVKQGEAADAAYLILSGMVRVHVETPGGRTMVNNLEADAFFGEAAILENEGPMPVRKATVESLCACNLLKLDRDVLLSILSENSLDTELEDSRGAMKVYNFSSVADKLRQEHQSYKALDVQIGAGRILPPHEPPQEIAQQLVLTRNVLLIDMVKCTRCDQCVRGCAEAHDALPRFHRANPDMRFGKWEVAGACLNCLDAPCQQVCPVGAITLLDDQAVQIHRDRCVSCEQCAKACPFSVIDMYPPNTMLEAPSMSPKKGTVATKCDLCLTENHDPPCVACCPYDAAKRVDPLEFFPELREWANIAHR